MGELSYPKLRFRVNQNLDKRIAIHFINLKQGGINFGEGITKNHPVLRMCNDLGEHQRGQIVQDYVEQYYNHNKTKVFKAQSNIKNSWGNVANKFFYETANIFCCHPWPEGDYVSYLSIFNCNPRFLKNCTFQVYFREERPIYTVCHELMHFMFYHYLKEKYTHECARMSTNNIWRLSEIFNSVVLYLPQFRELTNEHKKVYYPDHKRIVFLLHRKYPESINFEEFIKLAQKYTSS